MDRKAPEVSTKVRDSRLAASLEVFASVLLIVAAGLVIWRQLAPQASGSLEPEERQPPVQLQGLDGAATLGASTSQAVLVIYSDFQCPYCRRFALETLPQIRATYVATGALQVAFRHLPLERLHPHAMRAAQTAECAKQQGSSGSSTMPSSRTTGRSTLCN